MGSHECEKMCFPINVLKSLWKQKVDVASLETEFNIRLSQNEIIIKKIILDHEKVADCISFE